MRIFVAINIPENIKNNIVSVQEDLKKSNANVKWVEKNNCHITLKFLGEIEEKIMPEIISEIKSEIKEFNSFDASFYGLGMFPNVNSPKIVWLGIKQGENNLKLLAQKIENACLRLNFPKEKREFSAHLTLGRVKSYKNISMLVKKITLYSNIEYKPFKINKVDVMQSFLYPDGPQYKCLESVSI